MGRAGRIAARSNRLLTGDARERLVGLASWKKREALGLAKLRVWHGRRTYVSGCSKGSQPTILVAGIALVP